MRAAILSNGRFCVEPVPDPTPEPHGVVLAVSSCGLCGTDHSIYTDRLLPDGAVLGHEFAGTLVDVGRAVREWNVGDRVAVVPIPYCGRCELCTTGQQNLCGPGLAAMMGCGGAPGGLAELVAVPASSLRRLPGLLEPPLGALVEPVAVAWHAVELASIRPGTRVGVLGLGPLGLFAGLIARQKGALVFGTDSRQRRIGWAHALGLGAFAADDQADDRIRDLTRGGPDVVFEASGRPESIERAAHLARVGGRVVLVASYHTPAKMTPGQWFNRGISLLPSIAYSRHDFDEALDAIASRRLDVAPLVSARRPLDDVQAVFDSFTTQTDTAKLVIDPSS
jgi:2-desacetyl-2-hydroxyethyl bacteriochlorophyllide A dehydrogenase